jgi:hypothetical protein
VGFPHPTPKTEDSGISFSLSESYPRAFDDSNGEMRISDVPQQSLEGTQQELELPSIAIFPYCALILSFKFNGLSIGIDLLRKLFKLVRENW